MTVSKPQTHLDSRSQLEVTLKSPLFFAFFVLILSALYAWPLRWVISGAPLIQFFILIGEYQGSRVLPNIHLWPLFATLNLAYAICSTSWLLYWVYASSCYGMVALVSLCQFEIVASVVRKGARGLLKQLHFIDDKIAFFHIPALEIDTEVDGLMVLRGITFSLSTLSFVVHGIEVAIKLTEDIELAISTNKVEVKLFRSITISDCFANLKGGEFEMTFGKLEGNTGVSNRKQVLMEDSPLLKAASGNGDRRTLHSFQSRACKLKMAEKLSDGSVPENFSVREDLKNIEKMNPSRDEATGRYSEMIEFIKETSSIHGASQYAESISKESHGRGRALSLDDNDAVRAELCSQLHGKPSTPHPPSRSIKVTTIQNLVPPYIRRLLHRLPMLLRLLLNPIAYFHPVRITAISAAASGSWINDTLLTKVLHTGLSTDGEISTLQSRVSAWLSDANFVVELGGITCQTQVPFLPSYDIIGQLRSEDVMAYRTLPRQTDLKQVVRFGGADACFGIPSFLLPHHEHILPPIPSASHKANLSENIEKAKGVPKEIEAEHDLEQAEKDEANVKLSVHARLPACFDQELLDWVAALVKATKVIEMEKSESIMDDEVHGVREFGKALRGGLKEGVKKVVVDGVINEKWIARMVGKITRNLKTARGEIGYTVDLPVALDVYRTDYLESEGEKLLP